MRRYTRPPNIVRVRGHPRTAHFHNTADASFVVHPYTATQGSLLVNEIGAFDGTEMLPSGTLVLEVQSNGAWSMDLS